MTIPCTVQRQEKQEPLVIMKVKKVMWLKQTGRSKDTVEKERQRDKQRERQQAGRQRKKEKVNAGETGLVAVAAAVVVVRYSPPPPPPSSSS